MARCWYHLRRKEADISLQLKGDVWSKPVLFCDAEDCERSLHRQFGLSQVLPGMTVAGARTYFVRGAEAELKSMGFLEAERAKCHQTYQVLSA